MISQAIRRDLCQLLRPPASSVWTGCVRSCREGLYLARNVMQAGFGVVSKHQDAKSAEAHQVKFKVMKMISCRAEIAWHDDVKIKF